MAGEQVGTMMLGLTLYDWNASAPSVPLGDTRPVRHPQSISERLPTRRRERHGDATKTAVSDTLRVVSKPTLLSGRE